MVYNLDSISGITRIDFLPLFVLEDIDLSPVLKSFKFANLCRVVLGAGGRIRWWRFYRPRILVEKLEGQQVM